MSSPGKRTTQRAPKSCVQCSKRKLRCSKVIPCSNCVDRGMEHDCHRENVLLTGGNQRPQPRKIGRLRHRHSLPICERLPLSSSASSLASTPSSNGPSTATSQGEEVSGTRISGTSMASKADRHKDECKTPTQDDNDLAIEAAMSLESLAWGSYRQEQEQAWPGLSSRVLAIMSQFHELADRQTACDILSFHQSVVAWMHNVVYMPFFVRRCEAYLGGRLHQDVAWLSLYAATLCTGVYYMKPAQHRRIGMTDGYEVARKMYDMTLELIKESDFMAVQSIHSIQAICILVLCAHSFGDGKRIKTLLASANTIAQNEPHKLHLNQRPQHQQDAQQQPGPFQRLVDIEVRKRIWCFLSTQDWYLIGSRNAYSIHPSHGDAKQPPFNCCEDFDDMTAEGRFRDMPLSCPTQSTYTICLFRIAEQRRQLFDRLRAISQSFSSSSSCDAESFDAILEADSEWENTTSPMVSHAMSGEAEEACDNRRNYDRDFVASMRRALTIASWHQLLFIHRPFFCRAFQDRRYHYSRSASLAAARAILRCFLFLDDEARGSGEAEHAEIWTVPAHAVSACLVITLETVFSASGRGTTTQEERKSDEALMRRGLNALQNGNGNRTGMGHRRPSAIVDRGLLIIGNLLGGQPSRGRTGGLSGSSNRRFRKLDPGEISVLAKEIGDVEATERGSSGRSAGDSGYYYYHDRSQQQQHQQQQQYRRQEAESETIMSDYPICTTATTTTHHQHYSLQREKLDPFRLNEPGNSNSNNSLGQYQGHHNDQHTSAKTTVRLPHAPPPTAELRENDYGDNMVQTGQQEQITGMEDDFCMAYLNDPVFQDVFRW